MKKFLFLVVPSFSNEELLNKQEDVSIWNQIVPPYGVLSIISYVKKYSRAKLEFKVVDLRLLCKKRRNSNYCQDEIKNEISEIVNNFNPDFIGLSALFSSCYPNLKWVLDAIEDSGASVILGGALATVSYKEILNEFPGIEMCVVAEGEIAIRAIVDCDDNKKVWEENTAIVTRESLKTGNIPKNQLITELDCIPPLDLGYLEVEQYSTKKEIDIVTSRGCPFNCVFCASHLMNGNSVRFHSLNRVFDNLDNYIKMGYRQFRFFDDNFFLDIKRAKSILEKIISYNNKEIEISFPSGVMVKRIDERIAMLLSAAGAKSIPLAVESGSEYVLKELMNKPVDKETVVKAVQSLKKFDIDTHIFLVVGIPGETDEHRRETVQFIKGLDADWISVNIAIPLKGSKLHEICEKNGYLFEYSEFDFRARKCFIKTEDYQPEYIEYIAYKMNLELNFINNSNLKNNNYLKALSYFIDIITKYPKHAFGHYCVSKCYEGLDENDNAKKHMDEFKQIIQSDIFWAKYALEFGIA